MARDSGVIKVCCSIAVRSTVLIGTMMICVI